MAPPSSSLLLVVQVPLHHRALAGVELFTAVELCLQQAAADSLTWPEPHSQVQRQHTAHVPALVRQVALAQSELSIGGCGLITSGCGLITSGCGLITWDCRLTSSHLSWWDVYVHAVALTCDDGAGTVSVSVELTIS